MIISSSSSFICPLMVGLPSCSAFHFRSKEMASFWVAGSAQNSKELHNQHFWRQPIGAIIFFSCSRSSASTWISTSSYRFSSMVRFLAFRRFLPQLVQSLPEQLLELLPDLRLLEGHYRLVQFPLQIGDSTESVFSSNNW